MKKLVLLLFAFLGLSASVLYYMVNMEGPLQEQTTISILRGSGVRKVADDMQEAGIIDKPWLFEIAARVRKIDRKFRAGEYSFSSSSSIMDILDKIARGDVFYRRITLPEGLTTKQMIEIIKEEENLTGEITVNVKEGEMLAETYMFSKGDSRNSIVVQAKKSLENFIDQAWGHRKNELLKDKYEALILASIIEKETSVPEERGLVASVFYNRLKIGMALQTDPTVIYALTKGDGYLGRSLKKVDMKIDSPYNTYLYPGLPPTPICNVGIDSIEAALSPEDSRFLYFVADGKGGHDFSATYGEHQTKVNSWVKKIRSPAN